MEKVNKMGKEISIARRISIFNKEVRVGLIERWHLAKTQRK